MIRLCLAFFTGLLLFQAVSAQAEKGKAQGTSAASSEQNLTTKQSAELEEAKQLNSTVIKLYNEGKYDEAFPLAKRALDIREKKTGVNNEALIETLERYACLLRKQKREGEALDLEFRASDLSSIDLRNALQGDADIVDGKAIELPKPSYPLEARVAKLTGTVLV